MRLLVVMLARWWPTHAHMHNCLHAVLLIRGAFAGKLSCAANAAAACGAVALVPITRIPTRRQLFALANLLICVVDVGMARQECRSLLLEPSLDFIAAMAETARSQDAIVIKYIQRIEHKMGTSIVPQ